MKKSYIKVLLFSFISIALTSCGGGKEGKPELSESSVVEKVDSTEEMQVLSMPAPMQMAFSLFELKVKFDETLLVPMPTTPTSESGTNKAFRLGMYAVDIGFTTVYNKTSLVSKYMAEAIKLSKELKVNGPIELSATDKVKSFESNKDSLIGTVLKVFSDVHEKLNSEGRPEVAFEILTGSFIEGAYISTQMYKTNQNKNLAYLIGEQKIAVNNVISGLNSFELGDDAKNIVDRFNKLSEAFEAVEIKFLSEKDNPKGSIISEVIINDQQIDEINRKIMDLRKEIIGGN